VRYGNEVAVEADALEDTYLDVDLAGTIELPEKVNAVMNDGSKQAIDVTWQVTEDELAAMAAGGVQTYDIVGEAGGMEAHCFLSMIEYNFLANAGFEDGVAEPWVFNDLGHADELTVEDKATDSLAGTWHGHFWKAGAEGVTFTLEQKVENLKAGKYRFEISIMGGDAGDQEIYPYIQIGDVVTKGTPMEITWYNDWHAGTVTVELTEDGQPLTVGLYVKALGAGNGVWGKIDGAKLNSVTGE